MLFPAWVGAMDFTLCSCFADWAMSGFLLPSLVCYFFFFFLQTHSFTCLCLIKNKWFHFQWWKSILNPIQLGYGQFNVRAIERKAPLYVNIPHLQPLFAASVKHHKATCKMKNGSALYFPSALWIFFFFFFLVIASTDPFWKTGYCGKHETYISWRIKVCIHADKLVTSAVFLFHFGWKMAYK